VNSDRVVLVTGARKGIGRFLAEYYASRGARVVGCSRQPVDWSHPGVVVHQADVAQENDVRTLLRQIQRDYGRLDVVVNNAGIASMNHALLTPGSAVERVMATNVVGAFLVARESAKLMQRRRFGRIVNLTTVAVPLQLEGEAIYAASKAAVEMLTKVLARELADFGITCNAVGPSPIETDLIRGVPADKIQAIVQRLAVKRLGRYEDVSNVIDFFVRPESDYVTGQVMYLGGVS
jgi:3-oxoacyl-[acyl-carrier protein] reductase